MRPDELLQALTHLVDHFSMLELVELLSLAAEEVSRRDTCAGHHVTRGRNALLQAIATQLEVRARG